MRHRTRRRQSEAKCRAKERSTEAATDARRACRDEWVLRAPQRELRDRPTACRPDDATGLGGDQGCQVDRLEQATFEQQCLGKWRGHAQQRFVGEGNRALGHGQDLAAEAQLAQIVEECGIVVANLLQKGYVFEVVVKAAHELERHLQSSDQQVGAAERGAAGIEVERGQIGTACAPGDVGRIGVIEVGQQARVIRRIRSGQRHRPDGTAWKGPG